MRVFNNALGGRYDADEVEEELETEPVGDMARAEYVMSKVAYFKSRRAEIAETHKTLIEKADEWAADADRKLAKDQEWYEQQLRSFHQAVFALDPKRKTIHLPSGDLVTTPGSERVEVTDEEAFLASQSPESPLIRTKVVLSPIKTEIKTHIKETGEALPGVELVRGERKFEVKPS